MQLSHYSSIVVALDRRREYYFSRGRMPYKPNGFWVSIDEHDDGWLSWCQSEGFRLHALANRHIVTLKPDAKILTISTLEELCAFTREWGILAEHTKLVHPEKTIEGERQSLDSYLKEATANPNYWPLDIELYPDWKRLTDQYQGIIIAPYLWQARMAFMWYYPWDCASGCIWDTSAIESITHDPTWVAPQPREEDKEEEEEAA